MRKSKSPPDHRRRIGKDKEPEPQPPQPVALPPPVVQEQPKSSQQRKRRIGGSKRKEDQPGSETPKFGPERVSQPGAKIMHGYSKGPSSPEPSNGSGSSRSVQPSPTSATPRPPSRVVYDDYDTESATDALMSLSSYPRAEPTAPNDGPTHSPTISAGSRHSDPSPRPPPSHRGSVSSTRSHASPPLQAVNLKRTLSPGPDELADNKRTRMETMKRRVSSPSGRRTPIPSTRPSPIPFRTQPASHSPEARQPLEVTYPPSPPLPAVLPPHPRPLGTGLSSHSNGSGPIALPPITTLSPGSTAPSPKVADRDREDRMQVDVTRSSSPPSRSKLSEIRHNTSRSPPTKQTSSPGSDKKDPGV